MERIFDIFQLAALVCFVGLFLGRALYLRVAQGVHVFTLARGKPPVQAALELSFVVFLPVWLYEIVAYAWPLPRHIIPEALGAQFVDAVWLQCVGAGLVVFGLAIFGLALVAFGASWRIGIDQESPGALVSGGVFAWTRNPIFLFLDLYAIGHFLLTGRLVFLLFAVVVVAGIHYQIRQEEAFLERAYGEAYRAYCARVGRYFAWSGNR